MNQPEVNGKASICTWTLEFYYHHKNQIRKFVDLLMTDEVDFNFEYEKRIEHIHELYYITVSGSWANNLVRVAKMADAVDYKDYEE